MRQLESVHTDNKATSGEAIANTPNQPRRITSANSRCIDLHLVAMALR